IACRAGDYEFADEYKKEIVRRLMVNTDQVMEWILYDRHDKSIESHIDTLVTDGRRVVLGARHAAQAHPDGGYGWHINDTPLTWVTHWARIQLPKIDIADNTSSERVK
ncbi:hypothetical protein, partial [Paenibacillus sp. IHBB 3054]|uniref:hypothetical protein n=1 Tax=Paenibacillus sp. IHBB 3054 TaxID=3425689 RepID=UPI003F676543